MPTFKCSRSPKPPAVDEVHAVPRAVLEALYEALGEQMVSLTLHARGRSRGTRLKLPPFTLLAATTERGTLPEALRSRFVLQEEIGYYEEHDLATLVTERAESQGFRVAAAAASRLAVLAQNRGPMSVRRIANRLGTTIDTVIDLIEPYLLLGGFVTCSSRGRVLTVTHGATKNTRPAAA